MNKDRVHLKGEEQRKFKRLKTILPVDFTVVRIQGDVIPGVDWQQGFTSNVSKGGMCLEAANINESIINYLSRQDIYFELKIRLPKKKDPIKAIGEVCWYEINKKVIPHRYIIGLEWRSITKDNLKLILAQAHVFRLLMLIVSILGLILFIGYLLNLYYSKGLS